ncbi:hypothetical protein CASFOL_002853 [Castilleja foliolosa]|uniref:Uncharacterized protein n=1 Tax=Castilleja foliolosa TaxID=1961234 RepID=A0ABD3EFX6_9LAMI
METSAPSNELNCPLNSVFYEENYVSQHKLEPDGEENNSKQVNGSSYTSSHVGTDTLINIISEMLMDEDMGNKPSMLHDCLALQATEKSFYDALNNNLDQSLADSKSLGHGPEPRNKTNGDYSEMVSSSGVKKNRSWEDSDLTEYHRSNKQLANNINDDSEPLEKYEGMLICSNSDLRMQKARCKAEQESQENEQSKGEPNGRRKNKYISLKESVDLRSLLMQCAQAISDFDNKTLNYLMSEIRQHSSPRGDGVQRVAHYIANALEARLAGNGISLYSVFQSKRLSTFEILKAYKMFYIACPFMHMSSLMANRTICVMSRRATTVHVIDFGILYGIQWPCLIQKLSGMPGGPRKLRITGIDFPQPGFRPAERVEDTCRLLAKYGKIYGIPFEYNAIAQKWDTITLEDLKIEKNELLVVNSMYRLHNVPDETETGNSPRDAVLNLIKKINPDMFIHGITNGQFNSHFFTTRFKVAFFHFSTMFDMFEATIPKDDEDRLLYEEQFFGKEVMNIIACEGTQRIERPETYKHWEVRTVRAGLRQIPIDQEAVKLINEAKKEYHKNFTVDQDGKWIILGWKGRVMQAFSCWRPTITNEE